MAIVSLKSQIPKNCNAFCSASESNKRNPRDRTLDLRFFFRYKHIISLKNHLSLVQGENFPTGFGATFAVVFA